MTSVQQEPSLRPPVGLVAYLCTPQASFITGASITLDGGWTAH